jgi:hypothetical protein
MMCKLGLKNISNYPSTKKSLVSLDVSESSILIFMRLFMSYLTSIGKLGIDGSLLDHITDPDLQNDFGI